VILVPEQDLVARAELEPLDDRRIRLGGVAQDCDLVRVDAELVRQSRARVLFHGLDAPAVVSAQVAFQIACETPHRVVDRPRHRAEVGRIHRHPVVRETERAGHPGGGLRRGNAPRAERGRERHAGDGFQECATLDAQPESPEDPCAGRTRTVDSPATILILIIHKRRC